MCSDRNVPSMPTYLPPIGGRHEHVRLLHSLHSWETGLEKSAQSGYQLWNQLHELQYI